MAKGGAAKGPSKKTVEKAKAKLVEDKTFGLKNKNKSKKVQTVIKNVKNTVNQVHDKRTKKEQEERERKRMEKLLEKKREEELKALFKSADAPKKTAAEEAADALASGSAENGGENGENEEEDLYNQIEEELLEEEEMTIEDIIEKERAKIVGGTPVTLESFTKWQEFKMEQAKRDEERRKKAALESGHGLTGRDLFEYNKNLFVDDEEAADTDAYARDEDVDEDLFLDEDEDEENGGGASSSKSAEKKDDDEFDPDTWKEPKLPKVLLQEYLAAKKLALPKYESIPLPPSQQGHFVKVILPHLSKEYPPKRVYSNKKNAEHGAALIAYRDLTKTFLS